MVKTIFLCVLTVSMILLISSSAISVPRPLDIDVNGGLYLFNNQLVKYSPKTSSFFVINENIYKMFGMDNNTLFLGDYWIRDFQINNNGRYSFGKIYKGSINMLNPTETERKMSDVKRDVFPVLAKLLNCDADLLSIVSRIVYPKCFAIGPKGLIWVTGQDIFRERYKLAILDPNDGHTLDVFDVGTRGEESYLGDPQRLVVDSEGNFFITDYWDNKVKVFDKHGKFVRSFGGFGSGDGQFKAIKAIAIDESSSWVYVTDSFFPTMFRGNQGESNQMRVQKFTKEGNFITKFGDKKWKGFRSWPPGNDYEYPLDEPDGIAVDSKGNVYVLCSYTAEVKKFSPNGDFIMKWGKRGVGQGEMRDPQAIAIDDQDNVYIADTDNNRVQKFDSNGKFLEEIK